MLPTGILGLLSLLGLINKCALEAFFYAYCHMCLLKKRNMPEANPKRCYAVDASEDCKVFGRSCQQP